MEKRAGFSLYEMILVLAIIAFAAGIAVPGYQQYKGWARKKLDKATVIELNQAVDFFRAEYESDALPRGNNDTSHHKAILDVLAGKGKHVAITASLTIQPQSLSSRSNGRTFCFTGYRGETVNPKGSPSKTTEPKIYASWTGERGPTLQEDFLAPSEITPNTNESRDQPIIEQIDALTKARKQRKLPVQRTVFFDTQGKHTWVVPEGVTDIEIELIGAGGSGSDGIPRPNTWGDLHELVSPKKNLDRGFGDHGKAVSIGTLTLTGPFRLEVLRRTTNLIIGFEVFLNETKYACTMNVLNHIEYSGDGSCIVDFRLLVPYSTNDPWIKNVEHRKFKKKKIHYFDRVKGVIDLLKVQYKDRRDAFIGPGGGAGGYAKKRIRNLKGGESVFINVGGGYVNRAGETTRININGIVVTALGGEAGNEKSPGNGGSARGGDINQVGAQGLISEEDGLGGIGFLEKTSFRPMGSGGLGRMQKGSPGQDGMVKITYTQ